MEAYVHGVSTRSVDDLVEALGVGSGISKSEVSRICGGLDEVVGAFWTRRLDHVEFPYVYLDATYLHVRNDTSQVTSRAVVVATGISADGAREILGCDIGDSDDETFWRGFLRSLKARGLGGVQLVISDQHTGLVAALRRSFQGAAHQRCRVHFARNLLSLVPRSHQDMVAAVFRTIFAQPDADAVSATWDQVADQLASRFPKIGPLMDTANAEVLAFSGFPRAHWQKIWSTNPLERINKEIKRRSRVVGIFPNQAAVIRLVGAVLADMHDEWQAGERRYLSEASMASLYPERDTDHAPHSTPATNTEDQPSNPHQAAGHCRAMTRITTPTAHSEQAIDLLERQGPHRLTGDDLIIPGSWVRSPPALLHRGSSAAVVGGSSGAGAGDPGEDRLDGDCFGVDPLEDRHHDGVVTLTIHADELLLGCVGDELESPHGGPVRVEKTQEGVEAVGLHPEGADRCWHVTRPTTRSR